jgi:two-component system, OmpR family, sensor histidine kinase KdpD
MKLPDKTLQNQFAWRAWALVVALLAAATGFGFLWEPHVSLASQAMLYVLAVVIASYTLEPLASVACALGAVTAFNFFFVPPRWTFEVDNQQNLISLVTLLVVALVVSRLAADLRQKTASAHLSASRARQMQSLSAALAEAASPQAMLGLGQAALAQAFDGPIAIALRSEDGALVFPDDLPQELAPTVRDGMLTCMREAAPLGPGTGRWPGLNAWYIPLGLATQMQGAACIQHISAADQAGREHAVALCGLLAQALWRMKLAADMQAAQSQAQRQQVQSTFLAAISHDLRTPLAAVLGAASALQSQGDKLGATQQHALQDSIIREARYLSSLTENTLQLLQLTNAAQPLRRSWESMEEVVGAVLGRMRPRDLLHRITAKVPQGLPLVEADPVLLAQLLDNLLDNALKYSDGPITVVVSSAAGAMHLSVKDRGAEIAPEVRVQLFQPYARGDQGGPHGSGLGLALCLAIATAHGADLNWMARPGGGNHFRFSLPLSVAQPISEEA